MGWGNGNIGGASAGLNFKIIAYTTEENLLSAKPKENTIGIITEIPITSYAFSAKMPSKPVSGMVWIVTGMESSVEFNALRKNSFMVYPLSAKQYVGGAWVDVVAKSYQNGKWVDWAVYYYSDGNTFDDVTGGYYSNNVPTDYGTGSVEFGSDRIILQCKGAAQALVRTKNPLDLSGAAVLQIRVHANVTSEYNNKGYLHFYVTEKPITQIGQTTGDSKVIVEEYAPGTNAESVVELDVSDVTGNKYIFAALQTSQRAVNATFEILEIKSQGTAGGTTGGITPGGSTTGECKITATDDGAGNVYLSGVKAVSDGGNITIL